MSISTNLMDLPILQDEESSQVELESESEHEPMPESLNDPNEDTEVAARLARWRLLFDLTDDEQEFQLSQLVLETVRLERCQSEEWARRSRTINRALVCRDVDRTSVVMDIVSRLHRNPGRWRNELLRSAQGCRWMIEQWKMLREALSRPEGWDARQRSMALDLLGIPHLYREGKTPLDPPDRAEPGYLIVKVDQEINALNENLEMGLEEIDCFEREQTTQGLTLSFDRETQALRRFEAGCQRRYHYFLRKLLPFKIVKPQPPRATTRPRTEEAHTKVRTPSLFDMINRASTFTNKTERCSDSRSPQVEVETTNPDPRTARPAAPSVSGNRRERRKAAARARKQR